MFSRCLVVERFLFSPCFMMILPSQAFIRDVSAEGFRSPGDVRIARKRRTIPRVSRSSRAHWQNIAACGGLMSNA